MARGDLPHAHATYMHNGHPATLIYTPDEPGRWEVYVGAEHIGVIFETEPVEGEPWTHYRARFPGDDDETNDESGDDYSDDWRSVVDFLIDAQF
jgi:hypothetical protein